MIADLAIIIFGGAVYLALRMCERRTGYYDWPNRTAAEYVDAVASLHQPHQTLGRPSTGEKFPEVADDAPRWWRDYRACARERWERRMRLGDGGDGE